MKSVLITGAGRGIGRAAALKLAASGWHVFAGVRKPEDGENLRAGAAGKITPVVLDITNDAQVADLARVLPAELDAVVNNAGIAINAPVEAISAADLRRQFDVNVLGTIAVTQAVLPQIRAAGGRVVFVSSVSGRISVPWSGPYSGSKYALEGLADALRMELRPWGIGVSLVEPGATETDMWSTMVEQFDKMVSSLGSDQKALYDDHATGMRKTLQFVRKQTVPADHVVKAIERALTARRPKARYPIGIPSKIQLAASAITPTPINDAIVSRATGVPRKR
jgi:NAD(P)-dependent dehydrogenase (short-subunit alcohol dehydrogenase family)